MTFRRRASIIENLYPDKHFILYQQMTVKQGGIALERNGPTHSDAVCFLQECRRHLGDKFCCGRFSHCVIFVEKLAKFLLILYSNLL